MLLNPEAYDIKTFKQERKDGSEYGDSGPMFIGTAKNMPSVLIKQYYAMHAANEFIGCRLGRVLGVNTPQAWLFSKHSSINHCSFQFSVGIEYLEGIMSCPKSVSFDEIHVRETLRCFLLHIFLGEEDGWTTAIWNNKIYAYDFAATFCMDIKQERFIKVLEGKLKPSIFDDPERVKYGFGYSVKSGLRLIDKWSQVFPVRQEMVWEEFFNLRKKFLDTNLNMLTEELSELYPKQVADLYDELFIILREELSKV